MAVRYHIIKAGAGAGKTRKLVLKFLDILFRLYKDSERNEREFPLNSILAITFTNAAADEMRDRVIKILKKLSIPEMKMDVEIDKEFKKLLKTHGLKESDMRKILDHIIRNYSDLEIKTIDSFVNFLILSIPFCAEVFLTPSTEITNSEFYIEYACNLLFKKYGTDPQIRKIIENFVQEIMKKMRRGQKISWYIKNNLSNTTLELRNKEMNAGEEIDFSFYSEIASRAKSFEEKYGVNIFEVGKKTSEKKKRKSEEDYPEEMLREWSELFAVMKYAPYVEMYKSVGAEIKALKEKRRVIFIDELNMIAKNIIQNTKASPVIFEKLGGKIFYFLIDEFQDTSRIQWENLFPLIEEALSEGGELFCVGDSKQAIYGFRGGDPELLEELFSKPPFPSVGKNEIKCERLTENYRSGKVIIEFNNKIFSGENLSQWLDMDRIKERTGEGTKEKILRVYAESSQKVVRKGEGEKGFLFVEKIEKEDENEENSIYEKIFKKLNKFEVFNRFSKSDICFLLRKTEEVQKWTHFLLSKNIPVESTLTTDIRENFLLREIVELLQFFDAPYNDCSFASFITGNLFEKISQIPKENFYRWLENNSGRDFLYERFREDFGDLWKRYFSDLFRATGYLPLYDFVIMTLNKFEVYEAFPEHIAFLKHFEDLVTSLEGKGISTISDFIREWNKESNEWESEFTLRLPLQTEAVKVMTIHKAKGLQFPVVVLPGISLTVQDKIFKGEFLSHTDGTGLRFYYLTKELQKHSERLKAIYKEHAGKGLLEEINCLYVAMTRAMDELYIFLPEKKSANLYIPLILGEENKVEKGKHKNSGREKPEKEMEIPLLPPRKNWELKFVREMRKGEEIIDERRRKAMLIGEGVHLLLSTIKGISSEKDLTKALRENFKTLQKNPDFAEVQKELSDILNSLINFLKKSALRFFLVPSERVFTEKEVLGKDGKVRRIDRLIVFDDRVEVIDFKWGEKREKDHRIQLEDYISLISQIFQDKPVKGFLVYLDAEKVEEVNWA